MINNILTCPIIALLLLGVVRGTPITPALQPEDMARHTKATEMLKYMNTLVDPCEDFYEYTCGNYAKYNAADDDNVSMGPLELLDMEMEVKIMSELKTDNASDTVWDKQVKNFYRSCIAAPEMISVYPKKMQELIQQFGQMPALVGESWQDIDFDWLETIGKIARNTDEQIIIGAFIAPDFADNTKNAGILASSTLSLEKKSFYVNRRFVRAHPVFIQKIAENMHTFLGMPMDVANQTAKEIFEFEVALAQGLADDTENISFLEKYVPINIDELQKKYLDFWDTKELFTASFGHSPSRVYVEQKYMENAKDVLKNTSKRVIANYIFYTYAMLFTFKPQETTKNMEEQCLATTKKYFYKNLDNLMYRRLFTEQMKEGVYSLWQDLKLAFKEVLEFPRLTWIHQDTRKQAFEKLQNMEMQINSYEDVDFAEESKNLQLKGNDYVENMKSVLKALGDKARVDADKEANPLEIGDESSFSPGYMILQNKVIVPVSFLMPYHFYSIVYPNAYNYASLGFYLAHEIIHGFDNDGQLHDKKGNSLNWWDTKSLDEFQVRTKCFIKQYSNFEYDGTPLGEREDQGENIADNGGVRLAYEAYLRWLAKAEEAKQSLDKESLPGLNYTNRQLFFISYGQIWCNDVNEYIKIIQSMTDTHMPSKFRAIGPLSNFEEFHKEFKCPKGSAMNPKDTCEIY